MKVAITYLIFPEYSEAQVLCKFLFNKIDSNQRRKSCELKSPPASTIVATPSEFEEKMSLAKLFTKLAIVKPFVTPSFLGVAQVRTFKFVDKPKPGKGQQFRRVVHYPEDKKYTVKPLENTHLAGRDPVSGRKVANGIGGGVKHK